MNYIMPCGLDPSDLLTFGFGSYVDVYGIPHIETTNETIIRLRMSGETALERFLGCLMIARMPNEGLGEALFTLRDMLDFYTHPPMLLHGAPPKAETIKATVVERKKRPDLVIT